MPITRILNGQIIPLAGTPTQTSRPKFIPGEDDDTHARKLDDLVRHVDEMTKDARSSPLNGGVLWEGLSLTNGTTLYLKHRLGRAFSGYICTRAIGEAFSALEPTVPMKIQTSSNTAPIRISVLTPHHLTSADRVEVVGHLGNAANGKWSIDVVNALQFDLRGSVGTGIGGATGTVGLTDVNFAEVLQLRALCTGLYTVWVF